MLVEGARLKAVFVNFVLSVQGCHRDFLQILANPLRAMCRAARLGAAVVMALRVGNWRAHHVELGCLSRLASLESPLGGEVTELIRQRDPSHYTIK
jgi:Flp pilus assembly protein TadB